MEVHAKIPGVAVPRSLTHDGLPKKGSHAGTLGTWKVRVHTCNLHMRCIGVCLQTLGLELRGYFGDFSAAHRRLLTAEVAERLNLADRLELDPTVCAHIFIQSVHALFVIECRYCA